MKILPLYRSKIGAKYSFWPPICVSHVGYVLWVETLHIELSLKKVERIVTFVRSVFLHSNAAL
ncbi:hypothetical protein B0O95_11289 [Mycetohabitans endofungorum]|uniref:Uncharacterized protein n=1 Tax=Mycetohabitans endofungorum TaxID=417203 RepID=A0A2P5K867_9BURK|nr:hypothetical protein B0O95_11289 [Mycetohabitans endofungorum]